MSLKDRGRGTFDTEEENGVTSVKERLSRRRKGLGAKAPRNTAPAAEDEGMRSLLSSGGAGGCEPPDTLIWAP